MQVSQSSSSLEQQVKRPINKHAFYHAHIYFEKETLNFATQLCKQIGTNFDLPVGRIHEGLVGPHPKWSCQISFAKKDFSALIPWLDKNRDGLTILVHGVSDNNLRDHTEYAYWLGDSEKLNLSMFGG